MLRFALLFLLAPALTWAQQYTYVSRPDLYIDGPAMANNLTPWILENTDPQVRRRDSYIRSIAPALRVGGDLGDMRRPEVAALKSWMLEQEDHSIKPADFYRKAFELSDGDLQKGFVLAWDVLRFDWRDIRRNDSPLTLKLMDLTGELGVFQGNFPPGYSEDWLQIFGHTLRRRPQMKETVRGDNYSAWYHFSGTALSTYIAGNSRWNFFTPRIAYWYTRILIFLEEQLFYNDYNDGLKRLHIDLAGARFGYQLLKNLKRFKTLDQFNASKEARQTKYIYDNPEVYGPKWYLQPGQKPWEYVLPSRPGLWRRCMTALQTMH